jgi:hypothetical protein
MSAPIETPSLTVPNGALHIKGADLVNGDTCHPDSPAGMFLIFAYFYGVSLLIQLSFAMCPVV